MSPEIEESTLSTLGKLQAYRVWSTLKDCTSDVSITPTDDGGLVLEFEYEGRDFLVVIPKDGEMVYFTARCEANHFRDTGLLDFPAMLAWGMWLTTGEK